MSSDGYQVSHKADLEKVVNDRRAALDEETEVRPRLRGLVLEEFRRGSVLYVEPFPESDDQVPDIPRLRLVVMPPEVEWSQETRAQVAAWARSHGGQRRQYPGALIFCVRRQGRSLRDRVEVWLAWERVEADVEAGVLGEGYEPGEVREVRNRVREARDDARDEVWAAYTYVVVADPREPDGIKAVDMGAGHASTGETLCDRVLAALRREGLLGESVGASYIDRHWPPALQDSGAWPLRSLRQAFLDGSLIRLADPEAVLRAKIPEWVARGEFGLAAGERPDGYRRVWYEEPMAPEEIAFDPDVFLLRKERGKALRTAQAGGGLLPPPPGPAGPDYGEPQPPASPPQAGRVVVRVSGTVPVEVWNRIGVKLIPKLRALRHLRAQAAFEGELDAHTWRALAAELRTTIGDLGLSDTLRVESREVGSTSAGEP